MCGLQFRTGKSEKIQSCECWKTHTKHTGIAYVPPQFHLDKVGATLQKKEYTFV